MRRRIVLTACLIAVIGSVGCYETYTAAAPPPGAPIVSDLTGLVRAAPLIIVGRVIEIKPGREAGEGEALLRFNDIRIEVEQRLKGQSEATVVVEQVDMTGRIVPDLGPPYRAGERYVLFLQPGEPSRFITIRQGRYRLDDQKAKSLQIGPVADRLEGKPEAELIKEITALAQSAD